MKRDLTPAERSIVEGIYSYKREDVDRNPLLFWQSPKSKLDPSVFEELSSLGAIGYLAPLMLHPNTDIARKALARLVVIISMAKDTDLGWLDENIRSILYFCQNRAWAQRWFNANEVTVRTLPFEGSDLIVSLIVMACHNNGYVRYQALLRLSELSVNDALRIAFVRANDWVDAVSHFAISVIGENLPNLAAEQLTQYLLLLSQLQQKKRRDLTSIIDSVNKRLSSESGVEALFCAVKVSDYRAARLAFELLSSTPSDISRLLEIGIEHKDVAIRSKAFFLIGRLSNSEVRKHWLIRFAEDRYAPICKRAIYAIAETYPECSIAILKNNLIHESKGIRQACRFYLKRLGCEEFDKVYREALISGDNCSLKGAILGLSEVGDNSAWSDIERFSNSLHSQVKSAVVRAAGNLRCKPVDWYLKKVVCGCPAEAKVASQILTEGADFSSNDVIDLLAEQRDLHRIKYLLNILRRTDKWTFLRSILIVLLQVDERRQDIFVEEMRAWLKAHYRPYWYVKPDQATLDSVKLLLERANSTVGAGVVKRLIDYVIAIDQSLV